MSVERRFYQEALNGSVSELQEQFPTLDAATDIPERAEDGRAVPYLYVTGVLSAKNYNSIGLEYKL